MEILCDFGWPMHPNQNIPVLLLFLIFHRWNLLIVHEQNIKQELKPIHELCTLNRANRIASCHLATGLSHIRVSVRKKHIGRELPLHRVSPYKIS